jgi:hypothetical protein
MSCQGFESTASARVYHTKRLIVRVTPMVRKTTENKDVKAKIIDSFVTNQQGETLTFYNPGQTIYVHIRSKNKIGTEMDLSFKDFPFSHRVKINKVFFKIGLAFVTTKAH